MFFLSFSKPYKKIIDPATIHTAPKLSTQVKIPGPWDTKAASEIAKNKVVEPTAYLFQVTKIAELILEKEA